MGGLNFFWDWFFSNDSIIDLSAMRTHGGALATLSEIGELGNTGLE